MQTFKNSIFITLFCTCFFQTQAQTDSVENVFGNWVKAQFEQADSLIADSIAVAIADSTAQSAEAIAIADSIANIKKDTVKLTGLLAEAAKIKLDTSNRTSIKWEETYHDFGQIQIGDTVYYTFKFDNTGNNPAFVEKVKSSCGCTASNYTKAGIPPQEQGFVTIQFDSTGKLGKVIQSVVVYNNTANKRSILRISGEVIKRYD